MELNIEPKKKILIVDDEYAIRELVALSLGSEYETFKTESGKEALSFISRTKPDLIILDIMMPGMDGYEVCKKLKLDIKTKDIPIIMLTAKHQMQDLRQAIQVQVDEFMTKPFEPDKLKKVVDERFKSKDTNSRKKLFKYGNSLHYVK